MTRRVLCIFFLLGLLSCSTVTSLGLKPHTLGQTPTKIVWIQVAGLEEQHWAMLKYSNREAYKFLSLEKSHCLGKMWSYNLFKIRPRAEQGFMSQITASPNMKAKCEDYGKTPLWFDLHEQGYTSFILESQTKDKQSLLNALSCSNEATFLNRSTFFKMGEVDKRIRQSFHYQEPIDLILGQFYQDKSCQGSTCFATIDQNVNALWKSIVKNRTKVFFLIRDFTFAQALEKKDIAKAKSILTNIENIYKNFSEIIDGGEHVLLILSTAAERNIELPKQGKEWIAFEKRKKNVLFKETSLLGTVYATGSRSENFCGFFEESDLKKRILLKSTQKKSLFFNE